MFIADQIAALMEAQPEKAWAVRDLMKATRASLQGVRNALATNPQRFKREGVAAAGWGLPAKLWRLRGPGETDDDSPPPERPKAKPTVRVVYPKTALAALAERDAMMAAVERLARDTDAANRRFLAAVERILGRLITGPLDDEDDEDDEQQAA